MLKKLCTVSEIYQYLDSLFDQDIDQDTLFASGYLRGFISVAATDFGDEQQNVTENLVALITDKLAQAKTELNPQDNAIVQNFWLALQRVMVS
ncbi:MAG: YfcL family protein [Colwellia sp.]|nr:YfcL family protein [Colwellia sp.]